MNQAALYQAFENKYEELKAALAGDDLDRMKKLALEVHAMVHPAEVSGASEKTIADYVLDDMLAGNQNVLVPRAVFFSERSSVFRCLRVHLITEGFRRKGLLCGRFTGSAC